MGGIDFLTILIVILSMLMGYYRGIIGSIGDLLGIVLGLIISTFAYRGPVKLFQQFDITGIIAELVVFVFTSLFFIVLLVVLFEALKKRIDVKHVVDRIIGIFAGVLEGFIFCGILFFIMSASFNSATEIDRNKLPKKIIRFFPTVYEKTEQIGIVIPKMLLIPATYADEFKKEKKNIQFSNTNFYKLEKSSCIECNGEATFEGYFPRVGAIFIPKFVCNNCNRVSCGCQTYEMFHQFYNKCPIDIAKEEKIRFDCGWWPNYKVVTPQGVCPVDGNKIEFWLWEPPQKY